MRVTVGLCVCLSLFCILVLQVTRRSVSDTIGMSPKMDLFLGVMGHVTMTMILGL